MKAAHRAGKIKPRDRQETLAPGAASPLHLGVLNPDPELMSGAPLIYQLHSLSTLRLFALWPFSRLVHAWSAPLAYLRRSPILYRPQPEEVAT